MTKKIKKVLLVDDDSAMNYVNDFFLKHYDFCQNIVVEQYPEDALIRIKSWYQDNPSELPELILLDYNMPVMTGLELANEISKVIDSNLLSKIQIYILSSSDINISKKSLESNTFVKGYLLKPLDIADLKKIFAA